MKIRLGARGLSGLCLLCACSRAPSGAAGAMRGQASIGGGASVVAGAAANGGDGGVHVGQNPARPMITTTPTPALGGSSAPSEPQLSSREPVVIDHTGADNPAGLGPADVAKLRAGNPGGAALKLLYPYDGTVFPRGMGAPLVMWDGPAADAVYLHIKARSFEYSGCLKPSAAGNVEIPHDVWVQAGKQTNGKGDDFQLELSTLGNGVVAGPLSSHFVIAQATIKGSIYYNSYTSAQGGLLGGTVLRIPAGGGNASAFISTGCNGCHSVSADGSRLVSQFARLGGQSFALTVGGTANPPSVEAGPRGNYAALYPDGSKYLATSVAVDVARTFMSQGLGAPTDATLYDAATGSVVPNVGVPPGALMPMFSPDGTRLVFNDFASAAAHGLVIMHYDVSTDTASDYKVLFQDEGEMRPAWPFVLPDNGAVLFARTDSADFSGNGAGLAGLPPVAAPFSELALVDVGSGTMTMLARAMGYATPEDANSGRTYLPFGAEELHHSYFPTLSPVAAGGYYWAFFDSVRHYGNLGMQRQLWGAAIEIQADGSYRLDPSQPAFYVPGQEFGTGNHRAFAALDPCKRDGDTCNSGIDCCGGFCYFDKPPEELVEPVGSCSPRMNECARLDERCVTDADCCPAKGAEAPRTCIAGFCAELPVLQ